MFHAVARARPRRRRLRRHARGQARAIRRGHRRRGGGPAALPADLVPGNRRRRRAPRRRPRSATSPAVVQTLAAILQEGVRAGRFRRVNPLLVHGGIVGPLLLFFASAPLRQPARTRRRRAAPTAIDRRRAWSRTSSASRSASCKERCDERRRWHVVDRGSDRLRGRGAVAAPRDEGPLRASGYVEATEVRVAAGGRRPVLELPVDEGHRVAAGDLIARLDTTDTELALRRAEAERAQAVAQLRLLQAGARPEDIRQARAQAESAQADVGRGRVGAAVRQPPTSRGSRRCSPPTPAPASSATMRRRGGRWRRRASRRPRIAPAPRRSRRPRPGRRPARRDRRGAGTHRRRRRADRGAAGEPGRRDREVAGCRHRHGAAGRSRRAGPGDGRRSSSSPISIAPGRTSTSTSRWCRG